MKIKDLLPTSNSYIDAKCDYCGNIVYVSYKNYYRNVNRTIHNKYACSRICANEKIRLTTMSKYVVDVSIKDQSIKEKEIFEFISLNYNGKIIRSYQDSKMGLDVYLPDLKIGFEFNGLYWHSEEYKNKWYHINKTNYFKDSGIRIIHIWEDDWVIRKDIVKSMIRNILNSNTVKIFARKCYVKEVKNITESRKFLDENHIQGFTRSNLKLGLYYNGELVSLMTFDHFEGRNKMEEGGWNLNRFCNVLNTNVVGSASKLLKYLIDNYHVKRIVSYADLDWSIGNLYYKLGFEKLSESKPDYKYIVNNQRVHKSRYKKDRLNLEDKTKVTESQVMKEMGIHKIYDCGKIKFEMYVI